MNKSVASNIISLSPVVSSTTQLPSFVSGHDSDLVNLDVTGAADLVEINYDSQRKKKSKRWEKYLRQMNSGQFVPTTFYVCVLPDGTEILVDGQHRLKAFIMFSGMNYGKGITLPAIIIRLYVSGMADVERLYTFFDRGDQNRTETEVNTAARLTKHTGGVPPILQEPGIKAVCISERGFSTGGYDRYKYGDDLVKTQKLIEQKEFLCFVDEYFLGNDPNLITDSNTKGKKKPRTLVQKKMKTLVSNKLPLAFIMYLWHNADNHELIESFITELGNINIVNNDSPVSFLFNLLNETGGTYGFNLDHWAYLISVAWNQFHDTHEVSGETKIITHLSRTKIFKATKGDDFSIDGLPFNGTPAKDGSISTNGA